MPQDSTKSTRLSAPGRPFRSHPQHPTFNTLIRGEIMAPTSAAITNVTDEGLVITTHPRPEAHNRDNAHPWGWFRRSRSAPGLPRHETPSDSAIELPSYQDSQRHVQETAVTRKPPKVPNRKRNCGRRTCFCAMIGLLLVAIAVGGFLFWKQHKQAKKVPTHDYAVSIDWSPNWQIQGGHMPLADEGGMREVSQGIVARGDECDPAFHGPFCDLPDVKLPPGVINDDSDDGAPPVPSCDPDHGVCCHPDDQLCSTRPFEWHAPAPPEEWDCNPCAMHANRFAKEHGKDCLNWYNKYPPVVTCLQDVSVETVAERDEAITTCAVGVSGPECHSSPQPDEVH